MRRIDQTHTLSLEVSDWTDLIALLSEEHKKLSQKIALLSKSQTAEVYALDFDITEHNVLQGFMTRYGIDPVTKPRTPILKSVLLTDKKPH